MDVDQQAQPSTSASNSKKRFEVKKVSKLSIFLSNFPG